MKAIRQKNTRPEIMVRRILHARGFRFRLHSKLLPGTPDIILPKYRAVIFVHGCFWHGHNCNLFKIPKTRTEFWLSKINANQKRDQRVIEQIHNAGWRTLMIWECATKKFNPDQSLELLANTVSHWVRSSEENGDVTDDKCFHPC